MRTLSFITMSGALLASTLASWGQKLPPCTPGFQAPIVCCLNYPGTILAVDPENGTHQVRQQDNQVYWLDAAKLNRSCVGLQPRTVTTAFFTGKWATSVPPYPQYQVIDGRNYLVVTMGARAFHIEIRADGTYLWRTVAGTDVAGRWRVLNPSEYKRGTEPNNAPVLLIVQGEAGEDWYISRKGASLANVQEINIEKMRSGMTQSGTRMQASGSSGQVPGGAPTQTTVDYSQPLPELPGAETTTRAPLGPMKPFSPSQILVPYPPGTPQR